MRSCDGPLGHGERGLRRIWVNTAFIGIISPFIFQPLPKPWPRRGMGSPQVCNLAKRKPAPKGPRVQKLPFPWLWNCRSATGSFRSPKCKAAQFQRKNFFKRFRSCLCWALFVLRVYGAGGSAEDPRSKAAQLQSHSLTAGGVLILKTKPPPLGHNC